MKSAESRPPKSCPGADCKAGPAIYHRLLKPLPGLQRRGKAFLCLSISLFAAPFCFIIAICCWMFGEKTREVAEFPRRTVLVSGAPHTKGLHIVRTLAKVGHRVILADCEDFGCSGARWSCYVSKFYTVPNVKSPDNNEEYINGMIKIAKNENINWYIPVSHTKTALADTLIKQRLAVSNPEIKCLVFDEPKQAAILDDKVLFLSECQKLGLPVPYFRLVSNLQDIREISKQGLFSKGHYFLKPLMPYSRDRLNFTQIPGDLEQLEKYLLNFQGKIEKNQYFIQQFVKGQEFAANAIVNNGKMQAFHICPCSPMQIDYDVVKHPKIRQWVETFCKAKHVTGFLCFDFLEDGASHEVYCIECNPRLHSSVVSYHMQPTLARAIHGAMEHPFQLEEAVEPAVNSNHVYWLYNEIAKLGLGQQGIRAFMNTLLFGKEAVWDSSDPLPFFVLNHLQMPIMLLRALISGEMWNVTNYCLGQLR